MLECNQVAYIVLGAKIEIGYKKEGRTIYEVLPDGTHLNDIRRSRKFYELDIKEVPGSTDFPISEKKKLVLLGKIIESCIRPPYDYGKFTEIDLKKIRKKIGEEKKPLIDTLNTHGLNVKEEELKLYLIAVHD